MRQDATELLHAAAAPEKNRDNAPPRYTPFHRSRRLHQGRSVPFRSGRAGCRAGPGDSEADLGPGLDDVELAPRHAPLDALPPIPPPRPPHHAPTPPPRPARGE